MSLVEHGTGRAQREAQPPLLRVGVVAGRRSSSAARVGHSARRGCLPLLPRGVVAGRSSSAARVVRNGGRSRSGPGRGRGRLAARRARHVCAPREAQPLLLRIGVAAARRSSNATRVVFSGRRSRGRSESGWRRDGDDSGAAAGGDD